MSHKSCWFILYKKEKILLKKDSTFPEERDVTTLQPYFLRQFFLGFFNQIGYYCAEIDSLQDIEQLFISVSLKQALALIYPEHYHLGVKAYSVLNWDKNHRFCGRCASPTIHRGPSFERVCSSCELSFYPRLSPSIIVLIYRGDEILMARSPHFPTGVYSLIAGFVEPGESLEDTVIREVKEEVGVNIKHIQYISSQPWPFPDSLMIGFMAEYDFGDLVIDEQEIEDAGWYHYTALPKRPPIAIGISSKLLDHFIMGKA